MAESDNFHESESLENAPRRQSFRQNRPPYSPRGRGRTDPHIMKALYNFGVRDLREILDRKHQEEQARGDHPHDQTYNFLRDPMREDFDQQQLFKDNREQQPSRGRGRFIRPSEYSFIQNPLNIKVELKTATGERHYSLSQDKLSDIKHIPDRIQENYEPGRGRGRSDQSAGGLERGRGSLFRGRGSSHKGRGSSDRGRYGTGRGRNDTDKGRHDIGSGRYESNSGGNETDWDTNPDWGRNKSNKDRQDTNRGRYDSDKGAQGPDLDRSVSERSRKDSDRVYRRGRGRDPRGKSELMRAKSSERSHPVQFEENYDNKKRGAHIRSKSAESRGDSNTKSTEAEVKGRDGRGRGMNRGRGRGSHRDGRYKKKQTSMMSDINNSSDNAEYCNQDNWVDHESSGRETELENPSTSDNREELEKQYNEVYADEKKVLREEIEGNQLKVDEKEKEGEKMKESLVITSTDDKLKKRMVRFDLGGDKIEKESIKYETSGNHVEATESTQDVYTPSNLNSSK